MRRTKLVKTKITKPYVQKVMLINKNNIKKFIRPEWHREFRNNHVSSIKYAIMGGTHPSENITVNGVSTTYRIINGNHRMEALRRIISEHPKFSIEMTITLYSGLSLKQEIEIYEKVNNTKKESGMDRLKAHLTGSDIYNLLEKKFPARVLYRNGGRAERNVITATTVLSSYVCRNDSAVTRGVLFILERAKELDETDYYRIARFMRLFKRVFGDPSKENIYSSYNIYSCFAKAYYTLVGTDITEEQFEKKAKKIMATHTSQLVFYNSGVNKQPELYRFIVSKLGRKLYVVGA